MNVITYEKEIRRAISHFLNVFSEITVQRFDIDGIVRDKIRVPIAFDPKSRIFKDLINNSGHIQLPKMVASLSNISLDASRSFNKTHEMNTFHQDEKKNILHYTCPVPVNLDFNLKIVAKYYEDLYQILTNFIAYSNPYIQVKMREPWTGREIYSEILWNGQIPLTVPEQLTPTDIERHSAETSFTFKTWIFKAKETPVGRICCVDFDLILSKNVTNLDTSDLEKESLHFEGLPVIKSLKPSFIKMDETTKIEMVGDFKNVHTVYLSAHSSLFGPLTTINPFPDSTIYTKFKGISTEFIRSEEFLSFDVIPKNTGKFDVILVNDCGYLKLTDPADNNSYTSVSSCSGLSITLDPSSDTFNTDCSSCFMPYSTIFDGISVYSKWTENCEFGDCLSGNLPTVQLCD